MVADALNGSPSVRTLNREGEGDRWWPGPETDRRIDGRLGYATDQLDLPGLLHGVILRSRLPHARITGIDASRARQMAGVRAVVTASDIPGHNRFGIVYRDQPVLCDDRVRYEGDAVAAVAADTPARARAALAGIRVDYQALPVVDDAATAEGQAPLHDGGNLAASDHLVRGDVDEAFRRCAFVVEQDYQTPRQMHAFMETEGGVALPDGAGGLVFRVGCQSGHRDVLQLADILGLATDQVRVVSVPTGGAFGGKDELTIQPVAGLLALITKRPVLVHLDRFDSCRSGIKRHPVQARMKTGCDGQGRVLAHQVEAVLDTGAYASLGPAVLENYLDHATAPLYRIGSLSVAGRLVYTNNGVCGAFRGFGGNQATFAVESQLDALAHRAGMSPLALRQRNLRAPGEPGSRGQSVRWTRPPVEVLAAAARSPLWQPAPAGRRWLSGTGLAMGAQGNGLGGGLPDAGGGRVSLTGEGRIRIEFGFADYGQNLPEAITRLACDRLGCSETVVEVHLGDSDGPDSGPTSASRGSVLAVAVMEQLLPPWLAWVREQAGRLTGHPPDRLSAGPDGLYLDNGRQVLGYRALAEHGELEAMVAQAALDFPVAPDTEAPVGRYLQLMIATIARVEVDRLTGRVRVPALHHITAAGRVIHPPGYLGQIEGAAVMGLGMTLTEDMPAHQGCYRKDNLDQYLIPTLQDAPRQRVDVLDDTPLDDPFPVRGVGELGIEAVAPAIVAAIEAATEVRVSRLPVDPGQLLAAMNAKGKP